MVRTGKPLTMDRSTEGEPSRESFEGSVAGMEERRARESVAAHQATCDCHVVLYKSFSHVDDMIACCKKKAAEARDCDGRLWHVDPLCKVRPSAKV